MDVLIYVRNMNLTADVYRKYFGFEASGEVLEGLIERLEFGATHHANGYSFANAKDPDKNNVAISSRAFRELKL